MTKSNKNHQQFVMLFVEFTDEPAWRAMSPEARLLYVALKRHYNSKQGNAVYLATRAAAEGLGFGKNIVARCYRELVYYGFIVEITGACLGVDGKGKAARWRLTEMHFHHETPTRDYRRWSGEKFHEQKPPSYYQKKRPFGIRAKTESRPTRRDTVSSPSGHPCPTRQDTTTPNCPDGRDKGNHQTCPDGRDISSSPSVGVLKRKRKVRLKRRRAVVSPVPASAAPEPNEPTPPEKLHWSTPHVDLDEDRARARWPRFRDELKVVK
jgi:hypothetical protein